MRADDPAVLVGFALGATALAVTAGVVATAAGRADVDLADIRRPEDAALLQAWFGTAVLVALVLPAGVLAGWRRDAAVRRALGPSLSLLAVQIATEAACPACCPRGRSW